MFTPGTRVLAKNVFTSGVDMICEVSSSQYQEGKTMFGTKRVFHVRFQFLVAMGGEHFTMCEFLETMDSFEGTRPLKDLPFLPLSLFENQNNAEQIRAEFRSRGEIYSKCATKASFMAYGRASFYPKGAHRGKNDVNHSPGRIIVDTQRGYEAGHSVTVGYDPMIMSIKYKLKEYMLCTR